jgi:hypothetical protein
MIIVKRRETRSEPTNQLATAATYSRRSLDHLSPHQVLSERVGNNLWTFVAAEGSTVAYIVVPKSRGDPREF